MSWLYLISAIATSVVAFVVAIMDIKKDIDILSLKKTTVVILFSVPGLLLAIAGTNYSLGGLPRGVNDMKSGGYRLLSYASGNTVNALLMETNGMDNPNKVWGVAVPKSQWLITGNPPVVYVSKVAINGKSEVIVTDKPLKIP
jgi:hypothetical protein